MSDQARHEPARDPQDLARPLVARELAGDADGMGALYEPVPCSIAAAVSLALGRQAIRAFYAGMVAVGRKFELGDQRAAIGIGDLALRRHMALGHRSARYRLGCDANGFGAAALAPSGEPDLLAAAGKPLYTSRPSHSADCAWPAPFV